MPFDALTVHGVAKPQGEQRLRCSLCWNKVAGVPQSSVTLLEGDHWVTSFSRTGLLFGEGVYEMSVPRRTAHRWNESAGVVQMTKAVWDRKTWVSLIPNGIGQVKPNHYGEIIKTIWRNRDELPFALRILKKGVCDGCALGTTGIHDFTMDGVHLCMTRLMLLRRGAAA